MKAHIAKKEALKLKNLGPWSQVAEIEISYRNHIKPADRPKICASQGAYQIIYRLFVSVPN